jgi:hypothetical protein
MDAMVEAGFSMVFVGIESPNMEALRRTNKPQNAARGEEDFLLHAVRTIQEKGLEVTAGFILGLDGHGPEIFDAQVDVIQRAGIPIAMVGLLTALRGTNLHSRLESEGRLLAESSGKNVEIALNFVPEVDRDVLIDGYRKVLESLYGPDLRTYFARSKTLVARHPLAAPAALLAAGTRLCRVPRAHPVDAADGSGQGDPPGDQGMASAALHGADARGRRLPRDGIGGIRARRRASRTRRYRERAATPEDRAAGE